MNKMNKKVSKDFEIKLGRMKDKFEKYLRINHLNVSNLNIEDIETFMKENLKSVNKNAFYDSIRCLNEVLRMNDVDIQLDSKDYSNDKDYVYIPDEKLYTQSEVRSIINALENYQDKAIVQLLWLGVTNRQLVNIKLEDIAEDYSYILIDNKKLMLDDFSKRIVKGCKKQDVYYKYVVNDNLKNNDDYELNMSSEYLIKPMPTSKNNDGLNPMAVPSLQRRYAKIMQIFKNETGEQIILNAGNLNTSGILYDLFLQEVHQGKQWSVKSIQEYLQMRGIRKSAEVMYYNYRSRYLGE